MLSLSTLRAATFSLLLGPVLCRPFNITVWDASSSPIKTYRAWFGDGQLYIGNTVPPEVQVAFNITAPNQRNDLLYVDAVSPALTTVLPDPTFAVVNNAPGAKDAIFFASSAADLTDDHQFVWSNVDNFLMVRFASGSLQSNVYLSPTSVVGTYLVRWVTGGRTAGDVTLKKVNLSTKSL